MARRSRSKPKAEVIVPQRGRTVSEVIADRRSSVRRLYHMKARAPQIVRSIREERPDLLEGIKDPLGAVYDDIDLIKVEDVNYVSSSLGLPALADYIGDKAEIAQMALGVFQNTAMPPRIRLKALQVYSETVDDMARASGVPVDAPAVQVNLVNQLLQQAGDLSPELAGLLTGPTAGGTPLAGGMVDPLTFALDSRFCGLSSISDA